MRYVTIPSPVSLVNLNTGEALVNPDGSPGEPYTMAKFVSDVLINDPKFGNGRAGAKAARRMRRVFGQAQPGEVCAIDETDRTAAIAVMDAPTNPWQLQTGCQLVDFMDAFYDAPETCPQKPLSELKLMPGT